MASNFPSPQEYLRRINILRDAIVAEARARPEIMRDYEYATSQSGLPRASDYSVAQQQVAFREAKAILNQLTKENESGESKTGIP